MRCKPYSRYKPSGVEWLGNVPEYWDVKRLKTAATSWVSNVDKVPSDDELPVRLCNYTDVYYNDEIRPDMGLMETTATPDEIVRFALRVGDVLITKDSEEWNDIAVPALVVESAPDLVCGYHLAVIRPRQDVLLPRFLLRTMQASAVNQQFQMAATGITRYGLPKSSIGEAWFPVPSLDEQRAIADFLDFETVRIDTLVAKKRELTERLKEKRAALVSRVVARGHLLAARRKFKPSGIAWIGDVPEHWHIRRLRHISDGITVGVVVNPSSYVSDEGVPFLLGGDIHEGSIDTSDCDRCTPEVSDGPLRKSRLNSGDLVVVRVGYPGVAAVVPPELEGANCASMMIVRRHERFNSRWLMYALNSQIGRDQIEIVQYGAAQKQFNISHAVDFSFPFPPLSEQAVIADYLDHETANLDRMMLKVDAVIERLQEYRTALITAAVTGKIDVRGQTHDNRIEVASVS